MGYLIYLVSIVMIFVVLATSLNLVFGWTGLLAVTHAAFMGIGAYVTALLMIRARWDFVPALLAGALVAMILGWVVGRITLRLQEEYYVIASFGFQVIMYNVFNNLVGVTGGPMGLTGVPSPDLFGTKFGGQTGGLLIVLLLAAPVLWAIHRIGQSPYGRVLRAIREDEDLARSLGKDVARYKASVFAICAAFAALAGGLFATILRFVHPSSFNIHEAILILSMVIIGGSGNFWGGVLGAVLLTLLPEALSFFTALDDIAPQLRQITYSVLIILFLYLRPSGLIRETDGGSRQGA